MELTRAQEDGLRISVKRYRNKEPYTVISGYAGAGKSTLIKFIITALNLNLEDDVAYISYTGKASEVLRSKGCPNAMTAHKLLYNAKQMPDGRYVYTPRLTLEKKYKIIVVDEVSMLPIDMWEKLLSHKIHVLAAGDPGQLSPIDKSKDNHVLDNPHVFLDEVVRQAKESDIICLSMDIREGKKIKPFKGNDVRVFNRRDLTTGMYFWADQIICATNRTRQDINEYMRAAAGYNMEPQIGDKVICCLNSWDKLSSIGRNPLINGTIGNITRCNITQERYLGSGEFFEVPILDMDIATSEDEFLEIKADYNSIKMNTKFFTSKQEYILKKNKKNPNLPVEFNYGYAITCHKAQGSQWDKVLVIEENFPFESIEHARWVYTSVTRAISRMTLVLKN